MIEHISSCVKVNFSDCVRVKFSNKDLTNCIIISESVCRNEGEMECYKVICIRDSCIQCNTGVVPLILVLTFHVKCTLNTIEHWRGILTA